MLSGITSYLFGSNEDATDYKDEETQLTTVLDENEWLLVDVADSFPLPIELCPLVGHLEDSVHQVRSSGTNSTSRCHGDEDEPVRRGTMVPRYRVALNVVGSVGGVEPAPLRLRKQARGATRKAFARSNRVSEHLNHCKQQRRYNYKLCYSSKTQRTC